MQQREPRPVERMIFFTDAVVAIAMTLLILPLLDAVTEAARTGLDTIELLYENDAQLGSFALSFFIIALFWQGHDRLLARVAYQDAWIFWLNALWMFSIVCLPVATAMVGAMETDPLQLALYIGTMLFTSLIMGALMLVMLRKPHLVSPAHPPMREDLAPALANSILFALALVLALTIPGVQFWGLLALSLSAPLERLLRARLS